jgi:hypothetical protein
MFPIIAIGGAISAVASVIKGVSWLSDKLGSSTAAAASGKAGVKSATEAKVSPFEDALAAQAAGQTVPGSGAGNATAGNPPLYAMVQPTHGTDYDTLARMKAGMAAYGHIGEHHGNHPGAGKPAGSPVGSDDDRPVTRS